MKLPFMLLIGSLLFSISCYAESPNAESVDASSSVASLENTTWLHSESLLKFGKSGNVTYILNKRVNNADRREYHGKWVRRDDEIMISATDSRAHEKMNLKLEYKDNSLREIEWQLVGFEAHQSDIVWKLDPSNGKQPEWKRVETVSDGRYVTTVYYDKQSINKSKNITKVDIGINKYPTGNEVEQISKVSIKCKNPRANVEFYGNQYNNIKAKNFLQADDVFDRLVSEVCRGKK